MSSTLALWSALVGALLPPAISIIQQTTWPRSVRSIVGNLICLAAAAVVAAVQTDFTARRWVSSFLTVFVVAMTSYEHFWKATGVSPAIEKATTRRAP